ncbi:MAG: hypothetical protein ACYSWU_18025, partial [Planctomycetota bacterium]
MADEQDNMPQQPDPLDDFEISEEEMAALSPEEQEIIRQQREILLQANAEKVGEDASTDADGQTDADEPIGDGLDFSEEELEGLSPEEQEIIRQQQAMMRADAQKKAEAEGDEQGADETGSAPAGDLGDGLDFSEEELEGLSPEEQEIIRQQQAMMRADAKKKAEADGEAEASEEPEQVVEATVETESASAEEVDDGLDFSEEELEGLSPEEQEI